MAAASTVIPLGLLHMRSFQLWLRARGFHPRANPQRQIRVTRQGLRTLSMWFRPRFLTLGPTLGPCCHREMLMTDASLMGWGAVLDGRPAQGIWRGHLLELAHQLPRNEDCISGPEILPPAVERLPCPSAGRQHIGSLLHRSPGQTAVAPLE